MDVPRDPRGSVRIRRLTTPELTNPEVAALRSLMSIAFGDDPDEAFDEHDWDHALGGTHVVLEVAGELVAHASVVPRDIHVAGQPLRAGYVEAVATAPHQQGQGLGTLVMDEIGSIIRRDYELGVLGTGAHRFYERLGWQTWRGQAYLRTPDGDRRTPDEEGFLLVLFTPTTPDLDLTAAISCDRRPGDVW